MKISGWAGILRDYYGNDITQFYQHILEPDAKILEIGEINFPAAKLKLKNYSRMKVSELKIKAGEKYDYILISDTLGTIYDIENLFHRLKKAVNNNTRLVFNYQNYLWQPVLNTAEAVGLKSIQQKLNWLNTEDICNLLNLESFDIIKTGKRYLLPMPAGVISRFINKYVANLPGINRLCLTNYVVARPQPLPGKKPLSISIVIPARNEKGNIEKAVKNFGKIAPQAEIIFVEGHSRDGTWEEIKRVQKLYGTLNIKAVKQTGIGKADAVWKGFGIAQKDLLMVWDADLTVKPEEFYKFYNTITGGKGEFVFGSRLVYPMEKEAMRTLNVLGNKFFSWAFTWLLGQPIKDTLCGTKLISKKDYARLDKNRKYFGNFDPFGDFDLIFGSAKLNLKFAEVPIRYQSRSYGKTNISRFSHGWLLLKMVVFALDKMKFI